MTSSAFLTVLEVGQRRDVDSVVVGRREHPLSGRVRTVGDPSTRRDRCRDPSLGLVGRDADVDVDSATAGLGWVEVVEPQVWIAPLRIHGVFGTEVIVSEGGGPERPNIDTRPLGYGDTDGLHLRRVGLEPELSSHLRDLPGELDVALTQGTVLTGEGSDRDPVGTKVDVGEMPHRVGDLSDRGNQSRAIREGIDAIVGARAPEQDTPVIYASGIVERPRRGSASLPSTTSSAVFCGPDRPLRLNDNSAAL